jgi:hypothetical protein
MECLGLDRSPKEGDYRCGKGSVHVERKHPAWFSRSPEAAERLLQLVRGGVEASGGKYVERNSFVLRRGPYVIAATMKESVDKEPLHLKGHFVELLDARLPLREEIELPPGEQTWLLDLDRVTAKPPVVLAAAGRMESWTPQAQSVRFSCTSPQGTKFAARLLLPSAPKAITIGGKPCDTYEWNEPTKTVLLSYSGDQRPIDVEVTW